MTSSRIVRGTKGRILLFICGILIITGIIACYNNTRLQLEEIQKSNELCHQQQENLSTQLQVIFDYKQRLEKSLKTEKAEHQQEKTDYENRLKQQKLSCDKTTSESKLQYTSLQQHYNLLQTEFSDFKEEQSKTQRNHLDEVNNLQSKLNEVQGQLKKSENNYKNNISHLQTQITQLQVEKENLSKQLKSSQTDINKQILAENERLKLEVKLLQEEKSGQVKGAPEKLVENSTQKFSKQIPIGSNEYKLNNHGSVDNKNVIDIPDKDNESNHRFIQKSDNDSLNVLPAPNVQNPLGVKSSTKSSLNASKPNIGAALPLKEPSMTPETLKKKSSPKVQMNLQQVLMPPNLINNNNNNSNNKKVPEGVVPVPDKLFDEPSKQHVQKTAEEDKNDIPDEVNAALPGRYRNNIIADEMDHINKESKDQKAMNEEKDNAAHEVFDFPGNGNEDLETLDKINSKDKHDAPDNKEDKHHIDALGLGEKEHVAHGGKIYDTNDVYKDIANDLIGEDDEDDYPNNLHNKEPAVRN